MLNRLHRIEKKINISNFVPGIASVDPALSIGDIARKALRRDNVSETRSFAEHDPSAKSAAVFELILKNKFRSIPKDWKSQSLNDLAALTPQRDGFVVVESNIVLRALAIIAVVSGHMGWIIFTGGAAFLLALSGFNFGRFKSSELLGKNGPWPTVFKYLKKIAIPYLITVVAYLVWKREFEIGTLLLYSNLFQVEATAIFPIWFIQVLAQCAVLMGVTLFIPPVAKLLQKDVLATSLGILAFSILAKIAIQFFWDTNYLNNRVPHIYMILFWLGWCGALVSTVKSRITMSVVAVIAALSFANDLEGALEWGGTTTLWIIGGFLIILWRPYLLMPKLLAVPIALFAAASYYTFIFHMGIKHVLVAFDITSPVLLVLAGNVGGVAMWIFFDKFRVHRVLWRSAITRILQRTEKFEGGQKP